MQNAARETYLSCEARGSLVHENELRTLLHTADVCVHNVGSSCAKETYWEYIHLEANDASVHIRVWCECVMGVGYVHVQNDVRMSQHQMRAQTREESQGSNYACTRAFCCCCSCKSATAACKSGIQLPCRYNCGQS